MIITTTTTEAEIMRPVEIAKQQVKSIADLASLNHEVLNAEAMVDAAQNAFNAETLAMAQISFQRTLRNPDINIEGILKTLFQMATKTDDGWSGRKNDSRRSAQDAVRDWADSQIRHEMRIGL